jgi:ACS family tartrate transporter-like MFS transporter
MSEPASHRVPDAASSALERRTLGKAGRHIMPLMAAALLCAYLDRVNIGFAALTMNADLGLTNTDFGLAASSFAIGFALFAVPSALIQHRIGARRWIAALAVAWAIASASTALARNAQELLAIRFLVGVAEAGFAPGAVIYFSSWFPSEYRGRVIGAFLLISPLGFLVGGPLSSLLLTWHGWLGVDGWRWIFIVEAIPSLFIAAAIFLLLPDTPSDARWLTAEEKTWLNRRLADERARVERNEANAPGKSQGRWRALRDVRVWLLFAVNLAIGTAGVGITYFMPLIVRAMGYSDFTTGFVVAIPAVAAGLTLPLWGWWADRAKDRAGVVSTAIMIMGLGLAGAAWLAPSSWALIPLALALIGFNGAIVAVWTLPPMFLVGAAAAFGIALIKTANSLGAITGPTIQGALTDLTGAHNAGLAALAAITLASVLLMLVIGRMLRAKSDNTADAQP